MGNEYWPPLQQNNAVGATSGLPHPDLFDLHDEVLAEHLADHSRLCYPACVISIGFLAAAVVWARTPLSALPLPPPKYAMLINVNPSTALKRTDDISMVALYRLTECAPAPRGRFAAQGPPPRIPTDSALEVLRQLESMNLLVSCLSSFMTGFLKPICPLGD
uniref:Uncharacterized protein n=1 Tax=Romanomermis culicivorax TaxID=13658 RepID=A0A915HTR1_ROMCU